MNVKWAKVQKKFPSLNEIQTQFFTMCIFLKPFKNEFFSFKCHLEVYINSGRVVPRSFFEGSARLDWVLIYSSQKFAPAEIFYHVHNNPACMKFTEPSLRFVQKSV